MGRTIKASDERENHQKLSGKRITAKPVMFKSFPFVAQHDAMDCGPACLSMVAKKYGREYSLQYLRDNSYLTREGVSLTGLSAAAGLIGFESMAVRTTLDKLLQEKPFPCILFWNSSHFVVLYEVKQSLFTKKLYFRIADPARGMILLPEQAFCEAWTNGGEKGVALLLEPGKEFYERPAHPPSRITFAHFVKYIRPFRKEFFQLVAGMAAGSAFTLIFPFLTQSLIDKGIAAKSLHFVFILLLAQVFIFLGTVIVEIVRNWLILYISTRVNITIISDFFKKIMKLPVRFFDTKYSGDFYQRIHDHSRIEQFLTSQSLTTFFSFINFFIFFFVLFSYDYKILLVYASLTILSVLWSRSFFKKREYLDFFRFRSNALNNQSINEMINGIQEIKLNNFEHYKREQWEEIQVKLFNINLKVLRLDQVQMIGFDFINQLKNIIVTFIAAREVINGNITLGEMLSVSFIIGQLNAPVSQLIAFFRAFQDAQLSMKRLLEIQDYKEEVQEHHIAINELSNAPANGTAKGISIKNLSFQYEGPYSPQVLKNINLFIPDGKTTAIVGGSGSGKTTLMKLLLQFYQPVSGEIMVNHVSLSNISPASWREQCGVVMQDGFIFSETIARNIATKDVNIDQERLKMACRIANLDDYINILPQGLETKIGAIGSGISGGQKQRILIARAVYKNPHYIFFDEATSSLDTQNERIIYDNLQEFFKDRTVVVIAHRLSTVKNADQIIVLKDGEIVERGTHKSLVQRKGSYYNLVKNQLELEES